MRRGFLGRIAMTQYFLGLYGASTGLGFSVMDRPAPGVGLCGQPGWNRLAKRHLSGPRPEECGVVARSWPPSLGNHSPIPTGTSDTPQWTCTFPTLLQSWLWAVVETKPVENRLGSMGKAWLCPTCCGACAGPSGPLPIWVRAGQDGLQLLHSALV